MKKIFTILTIILAMALHTSVYAEGNNTEIRFTSGESVLFINGEMVEVEKPYVVGEGVTLVPLRVITEAFGTEVKWTNATRTIELKYEEISVLMQIDNVSVDVNGEIMNLVVAPELANSVTMVPLRFISETFGAVVTYDVDGMITVKKIVRNENAIDHLENIEIMTGKRVGSYDRFSKQPEIKDYDTCILYKIPVKGIEDCMLVSDKVYDKYEINLAYWLVTAVDRDNKLISAVNYQNGFKNNLDIGFSSDGERMYIDVKKLKKNNPHTRHIYICMEKETQVEWIVEKKQPK